ncbi:MAG: urease accessory protein UreD [Rhodospirillaceae bacterium]|jgi:urease accessory protein|nr:urease accessory protein UreD [Rhodospirillaceae bacterium]MBT7266122.1 urease accessory protein UreD [Rhodospirillaceae bacterium]
MYAAISPSNNETEHAKKIIVDGKARLSFAADNDGTTRLEDLYQRDPQRILFPNSAKHDITQAVVVTTSGGLVGGDQISVAIKTGENAQALVTAQAAEKIYRSNGEDAVIDVSLKAGTGSWLEYLPQETILFEGARLRRNTHINVESGGRLLAGEIIVFGRLGHGERFSRGLAHDGWEVAINDRLVWAEALHLEKNIAAVIDNPACFDGAVAAATAIYIGPDAEQHLTTALEIFDGQKNEVLSGATFVNGILVMRWLGQDAFQLRNDFGANWGAFRNKVAGLPSQLPRLWKM